MGNQKEFMEKSIFKGLEIVLEYERSLVKYFIAGNGAALIFILTLFSSKDIEKELLHILIKPMWAFGLGLLLSLFGFILAYLYSRRSIELSLKMHQILELSQINENMTKEEIEKRNEDVLTIQSGQSKLTKLYRPSIYIINGIVAVLFCFALIASLCYVSVHYG